MKFWNRIYEENGWIQIYKNNLKKAVTFSKFCRLIYKQRDRKVAGKKIETNRGVL